jgi:hypothetical protein
MAYDFQKDVSDKINDAIDRIAEDHEVTRAEVLSAATQTLARHRDGSLRAADPCVQACVPESDKEPK